MKKFAVVIILWLVVSCSSNDIDDNWGPWSNLSPCTRTCGGGVNFQERSCLKIKSGDSDDDGDDDDGNCVGPKRIYQSCNLEPCPKGSISFREVQCSQYDRVSFNNRFYTWIPYYGVTEDNRCQLYCYSKEENFYSRLAVRVMDGTRCSPDSNDVCVEGSCRSVGCDRMLGSSIKENKCRQCAKGNDTCRTLSGKIEGKFMIGYNDVLLLPKDAASIHIEEKYTGRTGNYLAIRDGLGRYHLNGNWRIDQEDNRFIAGTWFKYKRDITQSLKAKGPLQQPLYIMLLYQGNGAEIRYEYSVPISQSVNTTTNFTWMTEPWSDCSTSCGEGLVTRSVFCKSGQGYHVDDNLCNPLLKPSANHSCNLQPCPAVWHISEWGECSKSCDGGYQFRKIFCEEVRGGIPMTVEDRICLQSQGKRPKFQQKCNINIKCPKWDVGSWSSCNTACGHGKQSRVVLCRSPQISNVSASILSNDSCEMSIKPISVKDCELQPCEGFEWVTSQWSVCHGMCGSALQSREVMCISKSGKRQPDSSCKKKSKPETSRLCSDKELSDKCNGVWYASQWSTCSVTCGSGIQLREVICLGIEGDQLVKLSADSCSDQDKLMSERECTNKACGPSWFVIPWNKCSVPCGGGYRKRDLLCVYNDNIVPQNRCKLTRRLFIKESCNEEPCGKKGIGECVNSIHGCCPDRKTPALGENFYGCPSKVTEPPLSCHSSDFGCCLDLITDSQGPFNYQCPKYTCNETEYGCCSDDRTPSGMGGRGCPEKIDCRFTDYGCCPDNLRPADGPHMEGCFKLNNFETTTQAEKLICESTEYGCCSDGRTPASGEYGGCDDDYEASGMMCEDSEFGCCPDSLTAAAGPNNEACNSTGVFIVNGNKTGLVNVSTDNNRNGDITLDITPPTDLLTDDGLIDSSKFKTIPSPIAFFSNCTNTTFGCCQDGTSTALGLDYYGCLHTTSKKVLFSTEVQPTPLLEISNTTSNEEIRNTSKGTTLSDTQTTEIWVSPPETTENPGFVKINTDPDIEAEYWRNHPLTQHTTPTTVETHYYNDYRTTVPMESKDLQSPPPTKSPAVLQTTISEFGYSPVNTTAVSSLEIVPPNSTEVIDLSSGGSVKSNTKSEQSQDIFSSAIPITSHTLDSNNSSIDNDMQILQSTTVTDGIVNMELTTTRPRHCNLTIFGCCPDGENAATGPALQGCKGEIVAEPDCLNTPFGCCDDGFSVSSAPDMKGCQSFVVISDCLNSLYGCCKDGITAAKGYDNGGCPEKTIAPCKQTEFGCCMDGKNTAAGPNFKDCGGDCKLQKFGCCPGIDQGADGPNLAGCPGVQSLGDVCGMPSQTGPCRNFSVMWYYDMYYGDCTRFWYGGCEGNSNRFRSFLNCQSSCLLPEGIDICQLPPEVGNCRARIASYFYDPDTGVCRSFKYGGCGGNNNRFSTLDDCKKRCIIPRKQDVCSLPKVSGPCHGKFKRWHYDQSSGSCLEYSYGGCKGNANRFFTLDECKNRCEKSKKTHGDVCKQPKVEGPCRAYLRRWYYNHIENKCIKFVYGGCEGNGNNFDSEADCKSRCSFEDPDKPQATLDAICTLPVEPGPCIGDMTRWHYNRESGQCKKFTYGGCSGNPNRFFTKEQCVSMCPTLEITTQYIPTTSPIVVTTMIIDKCTLKRDEGPCNGFLAVWYFDASASTCRRFLYSGCGGNTNRFGSWQECEESCLSSTSSQRPNVVTATISPTSLDTTILAIDLCAEPVDKGPCDATLSRSFYNKKTNLCEQFIFSGCQGNANIFDTINVCNEICVERKRKLAAICHLPKNPGPCNALLVRWYHNSETKKCEKFSYSGCPGNENRFLSKDECKVACLSENSLVPFVQDLCHLPIATGRCGESLPRWGFNYKKKICEEFNYTGCHGNGNQFNTYQECQSSCVSQHITDVCQLSKAIGPCHQFIPRWYFNSQSGTCKKFMFGGCHGNKNRFLSEAECTETCQSQYFPSASNSTSGHCSPLECNILCPYGYVQEDGCNTCKCLDPCSSVECSDKEQCAVEIYQCIKQPCRKPKAVCRLKEKPGQCPPLEAEDVGICDLLCGTDADCVGDGKCCSNGCGQICMPLLMIYNQSKLREEEDACKKSIYGCCLDNKTPAGGYNLRGCPEKAPKIITSTKKSILTVVDELVVLPCQAIGAPRPMIIWYKDGVPIVMVKDMHFKKLKSGSLQISQVKTSDAGFYTCRASNGVGRAATRNIGLVVQIPTEIGTMLGKVKVKPRSQVLLDCPASGVPRPQVRWMYNYQTVSGRWGDRIYKLGNNSLKIQNIKIEDKGEYMCEAYNGVGEVRRKSLKLIIEVPIEAQIMSHNQTFVEGSAVLLICNATGFPVPKITWYKDDGNNLLQTINSSDGVIVFSNVTLEDAGTYICEVANDIQTLKTATLFTVERKQSRPTGCKDMPKFANCAIIVRAKMCKRNKYFIKFCCASCYDDGQLP